MKNPKDIETMDRDEMMCPRCQTEGLEPHPGFASEYDSKRVELIRATRCPNERCEFHKSGVPKDQMKDQMPHRSFIPSNLDMKDFALVSLSIGAIIFILFTSGFNPFGGGGSNNGDIVNVTNITIEGNISASQVNGTVHLYSENGSELKTSKIKDGQYNIKISKIDPGNYTLYPNYNSGKSPPGKNISITNRMNTNKIIKNFSKGPLDSTNEYNRVLNNNNLSITYKNPKNIENLTFNLSSLEKTSKNTTQREVKLNSNGKFYASYPLSRSSQKIFFESSYTNQVFSKTDEFNGEKKEFKIFGNLPPENLRIELSKEARNPSQSRIVRLNGTETKTQTINVLSSKTEGAAVVELSNGNATAFVSKEGVWEGQSTIDIKTKLDKPKAADISVSPNTTVNSKTEIGVTNGTINLDIEPESRIVDGEVSFYGVQSSSSRYVNISFGSEINSTRKLEKTLEIQDPGKYRVIAEKSSKNSEFLQTYYEINGEKTDFDKNNIDILDLKTGDSVKIVGQRSTNIISNHNVDNMELNSNIIVEEFVFINSEGQEVNNTSPGSDVSVRIKVRNTGNNPVSDTIKLYQHKNNQIITHSKNINLDPNEVKTYNESTFGQLDTSNTVGAEKWVLNNRSTKYLLLGSNEFKSGSGNVSLKLSRLDNIDRSINVSTNSNNSFNCNTDIIGSCNISKQKIGNQKIKIEDLDKNIYYKTNLITNKYPKGIEMDFNDDGLVDYTYDGILTNKSTGSSEIPTGNTTIGISTDNNVSFDYTIRWESENAINKPTISVDDETILSEERSSVFVNKDIFFLKKFEKGKHNITFSSNSGGYTAEIKWTEQNDENYYPFAYIDGLRACNSSDFSDDLSCNLNPDSINLDPGEHNISFKRVNNVSYDIIQNSTAIARNVTVNSGNNKISFKNSGTMNPWSRSKFTDMFRKGLNQYTISVKEENGIDPNINLLLRYTINKQPSDVVNISINASNTTNTETVKLSNSTSGNKSANKITIPSEWLKTGKNVIQFSPKPKNSIFEFRGTLNLYSSDRINISDSR